MTQIEMAGLQESAKDPRTLIDADLFGRLTARVQEQMPVAPFYAERVVEQALVFLVACAANPGEEMLSPSTSVDPGWHAFLMFTAEYAEFCAGLTGGGFIHHVPVVNEDITSGNALARTVDVLLSTGYRVDIDMWSGWVSCGSGCGFRVVQGAAA